MGMIFAIELEQEADGRWIADVPSPRRHSRSASCLPRRDHLAVDPGL